MVPLNLWALCSPNISFFLFLVQAKNKKYDMKEARLHYCHGNEERLLNCYETFYTSVCVCVRQCAVCVWVWPHVTECCSLSISGHTITLHCEVFKILYDNAFLPNWLLRGMFYIILWSYVSIPDLCVCVCARMCSRVCVRVCVKMIIWRELCLLRLLLDCDFDWFHSNWKPTWCMFLDCEPVSWPLQD